MSIPINCPNCGQAYKLADRFAGLAVRCKQCRGAIEVPTLPNLHVRYEAVPLPAVPLDPSWTAAPPAAPPKPRTSAKRPRRRKSNVALFIGLSFGAAGLFVLMAAAMIVLLVMHKRPQLAGMQPGAGWPPQQPANAPVAGRAAPAPAVVGPTPDELLRDLLAAYNDVGNALASVVDAKSANAQAAGVVSNVKRMIQIGTQLDNADMSVEDDKRLRAQYEGLLSAAKTRIDNEIARIKRNPEAAAAMGRNVQWEDLKQGVTHLAKRSRRKARLRGPMQSINRGLNGELPNPAANMPADQIVVIVIDDLPDQRMATFLAERLSKQSGATSSSFSGSNRTMTVTLAPVRDLHGLAAKIEFGKVTRVDDGRRTIFVRADAAKLPEPLGPEVTNPLSPDFYRQNLKDLASYDKFRSREAAIRLRSAPPKELRAEISGALLKLLADDDLFATSFLTPEVIRALPVWSTADEAVPILLNLLRDGRGNLGDASIEALGKFKDARAIEPILQKAKWHESASQIAIRSFGESAEPAVIKYAASSDDGARRLAALMLGDIGTRKSVPILEGLLWSRNAQVQQEASRSLKRIEERRNGPVKSS